MLNPYLSSSETHLINHRKNKEDQIMYYYHSAANGTALDLNICIPLKMIFPYSFIN